MLILAGSGHSTRCWTGGIDTSTGQAPIWLVGLRPIVEIDIVGAREGEASGSRRTGFAVELPPGVVPDACHAAAGTFWAVLVTHGHQLLLGQVHVPAQVISLEHDLLVEALPTTTLQVPFQGGERQGRLQVEVI